MGWSRWELLDDGSFNGMKKYIRSSDEDQGTVQVRYEQDATPIIDDNKRVASEYVKSSGMGDMLHVASIPAIVQMEWMTKYGVHPWDPNHDDARRRLLNSSEYCHLKRAPIVI